MLSLTEFKNKAIAEEKQYYKNLLSEGKDLPEAFLAEEALQEYLIESFSQTVEVKDSIDLSEEVEIEGGLLEVYDFVPSLFGEKFDIEMEVSEDVSVETLLALKEHLLAEDYDIVFSEAERAKVTFSRAGGSIQKKKKCPTGTKLSGNKCIPQTGTEKAGNKKLGIKLKRAKRAQGAAGKKRAAVKAQITKKRVASKSRNFSGT